MHFKTVDVVVVGAGIAGASIASEYASLGVSVGIVDEAPGPGRVTSAHDGAMAHPALGRTASRLHHLALAAFRMVEQECANMWSHRGVFALTKMDVAVDALSIQNKLEQLGITAEIGEFMSRELAQKRFGIKRAGVWFPRAGSLDLAALCAKRLQVCKSQPMIWSTKIESIQYCDNRWHALDQNGSSVLSAPKLILANAFGAQDLLNPFGHRLYLKPVRGQLNIFRINQDSKLAEQLPKINLSGDGYCMPPVFDRQTQSFRWLVGSSYDENDDSLEPTQQSDLHNRQLVCGLLKPQSIDIQELKTVDRFVGIRCVSKDRLPLIGEVPGLPNLFIATALGSRGLLWATLASKVIPALSHPSALALERLTRFGLDPKSASFLSPARFLAGALASNSKPILPFGSKAK